VSPITLPTTRKERGLRGAHVLGLFLAFFGAVFVVNGAMIFSALSTHTGLVANEPYRKGLHYNERIAADERQSRRGWTEQLEVSRDGRVSLSLAEADGRMVQGLRIEGALGRPSTDKHDIRLALAEGAPGIYAAQIAPLAEGNWLVTLEAWGRGDSQEPVYRLRRRLWLKR
jgi:nitrogen fixation protein FixH